MHRNHFWLGLSLLGFGFVSACSSLGTPPSISCRDVACPETMVCDQGSGLCVTASTGTIVELDASLPPEPPSEPRPEETCVLDHRRDCKTRPDAPCNNGLQICLLSGRWSDCVSPSSRGDGECLCTDGEMRSCYTGHENTRKIGVCKDGRQTCRDRAWAACLGETIPRDESCDGEDNNCDGKIDETFPEQGQSCKVDGERGLCALGAWTCQEGKKVCVSKRSASPEICDGIDNDCDGKTDENDAGNGPFSVPCTQTNPGCRLEADGKVTCLGLCAAGVQTCVNGVLEECKHEKHPTTEVCDGQDNDCDGRVDERVTRPCYKGDPMTQGKGSCKAGVESCENGQFGDCQNQVLPSTQLCNGNSDDDCDGKTDEGCECTGVLTTQPCGIDIGECSTQRGIQTCESGKWTACAGDKRPADESCNGKDDDCDGKIDEGVTRPCWKGTQTTRGTGECKDGIETCTHGTFGTCQNEVLPKPEDCNGKDDDCDGKTDEALQRECFGGSSGCKADAKGLYTCEGLCKAGTQVCSGGKWEACVGEVRSTAESCNGKDDDCDGSVDEQIFCPCIPFAKRPCYEGPLKTEGVGLCKGGEQVCSLVGWSTCKNQILPQTELCDNKDNDCDGKIDEGISIPCYTGPTGTVGCTRDPNGVYSCKGLCQAGTLTCVEGTLSACRNQIHPSPEICDGQDNNCDGRIDEIKDQPCSCPDPLLPSTIYNGKTLCPLQQPANSTVCKTAQPCHTLVGPECKTGFLACSNQVSSCQFLQPQSCRVATDCMVCGSRFAWVCGPNNTCVTTTTPPPPPPAP